MHRIALLGTALLLLNTSCEARHRTTASQSDTVPTDYYAPADGLCGSALKQALSTITRQHEVFAYGSLWYHYEKTDVVPGTECQVFDYYSPTYYEFTGLGTAPAGANKEHACPQSWWGSGALSPAYTDLFNVMPSEESANSAKSHYPLGVTGESVLYRNTRMQVGPSSRSAYKGNVFEPCDEFKGDFARIYFYVATTYADAAWGCKESVANTVAFVHEDYPTLQPWIKDLLLEWNAADPVSQWEITRNERVFAEQGNRNPFIDYPQLADHIWGSQLHTPFTLSEAQLNGSASGSSGIPDDNTGEGGGTAGSGDSGSDQPIGGEDTIGTVLLDEDFSAVTTGNDRDNNGSSMAWSGNDNFPTVATAYQAGGAIKLGSAKNCGQLQSRRLDNAAGTSLVVLIQVKGWTTVEGTLQVSLTGQPLQEASYTHTMADGYETLEVCFDHCQANSQLTIATSQKRAFITAVKVGIAGHQDQAIHRVSSDAVAAPRILCDLMGHPVSADDAGIIISPRQHKAWIRY